MGRALKQIGLFLDAAEELYKEEKISKEDYSKLIDHLEISYKEPSGFIAELLKWASDVLSQDRAEKHAANLDVLVGSFLESPDADDRQTRVQVLQMAEHFRSLFRTVGTYDHKQLLLELVKSS